MPYIYKITENQRQGRSAVITGFEGAARFLQIPPELEGVPVTVVGGHAFSGRKDLLEVRIPESVTEIGSYAFYNCRNLRMIELTDCTEDYGDGVLRMCPGLRTIRLNLRRGYFRLLKDLIEDTEEELHFHLVMPDGESAKLTFPRYYSEVREDTRARAIHSSIRGAGFTYRQCVSRKGIDFAAYDASFERSVMADILGAAEIALERMECPYELTEKAGAEYRAFLTEHSNEILPWLVAMGRDTYVRLLTECSEISRETLDRAAKLAADERQSEICSILMDAVKEKYPASDGPKVFSLDDFF